MCVLYVCEGLYVYINSVKYLRATNVYVIVLLISFSRSVQHKSKLVNNFSMKMMKDQKYEWKRKSKNAQQMDMTLNLILFECFVYACVREDMREL